MTNLAIDLRELVIQHGIGSGEAYTVRLGCLMVEPGELALVTGETGSGKSSILHVLACMMPPTSAARLEIAGVDVLAAWKDPGRMNDLRRTSIGYAQQRTEVLSALTLRQNVVWPALMAGCTDVEPQVAELLREFGRLTSGGRSDLAARADSPLHRIAISGGQMVRVGLARAVAHRPMLLVADEPTAGLDRRTARRVISYLDHLRRHHAMAVVLATHDVSLVRPFATQILHLTVNDTDSEAISRIQCPAAPSADTPPVSAILS